MTSRTITGTANGMVTGMVSNIQTKVRENRLRTTAERRGLRLVKSRRRDPQALDYGTYWLEDASEYRVAAGDLDAIEAWLEQGASELPALTATFQDFPSQGVMRVNALIGGKHREAVLSDTSRAAVLAALDQLGEAE